MTEAVRCYDCGESYAFGDRTRCACGEPLWFDVDPTGFGWDRVRDAGGVWRYAELLPVEPADGRGLGVASGRTPLVRTPALDEYAGCRLSVKDEGENPTGSFKDRGSAVGVAAAAARGRPVVGTVSHGNMAMSMSAHAASQGLECVVLVPERIPEGRLEFIAQYDPTLLRIAGDYGQLYYDTLELAAEVGITFVNSDTPLRVAGQKTVAFELCEQFEPGVPDAIVAPVSSGGHASAIWKGLRELRDAGAIDELPRLYFVQSANCDPIATAYRTGADDVSSVSPGETVAFSIANGAPPSGNRALAAARATGGAVLSVPDDELLEATRRLAADAGLCVEPSSATTLAGVRRLAADGHVSPEESVVAVATGTGFKEGTAGTEVSSRLVDLEALPEALASVGGAE